MTPPTPDSCRAGGSTYLSTKRGEPSILTSSSGTAALVLASTGVLTLQNQATRQVVFRVGPFASCQPPYRVRLLQNGALVLSDGRNKTLWTSQTACQGNSRCYSMRVLDSLQADVLDGNGIVTWSSSSPGAAGHASDRLQLQSNGSETVACLQTGIRPVATTLVSPDMATYRLSVAVNPTGLQLSHTASGQVKWRVNSSVNTGTGSMCLQPDGSLILWGRSVGRAVQLAWSSSGAGLYTAPGAQQHYFIARVSARGALQVLDETCSILYDSVIGSRSGGVGGGSSNMQPKQMPPPVRHQATSSPPPARTARRPPPKSISTSRKPPAPRPPVQVAKTDQLSAIDRQTGRAQRPPPKTAAAASKTEPTHGAQDGQPADALLVAADVRIVARGRLCGGISLCGADEPCPAVRCAALLQCERHSAFVWQCA